MAATAVRTVFTAVTSMTSMLSSMALIRSSTSMPSMLRQPDVEQHEIDLGGAHDVERARSVGDVDHLVGVLEDEPEGFAHAGFVVDDETDGTKALGAIGGSGGGACAAMAPYFTTSPRGSGRSGAGGRRGRGRRRREGPPVAAGAGVRRDR